MKWAYIACRRYDEKLSTKKYLKSLCKQYNIYACCMYVFFFFFLFLCHSFVWCWRCCVSCMQYNNFMLAMLCLCLVCVTLVLCLALWELFASGRYEMQQNSVFRLKKFPHQFFSFFVAVHVPLISIVYCTECILYSFVHVVLLASTCEHSLRQCADENQPPTNTGNLFQL